MNQGSGGGYGGSVGAVWHGDRRYRAHRDRPLSVQREHQRRRDARPRHRLSFPVLAGPILCPPRPANEGKRSLNWGAPGHLSASRSSAPMTVMRLVETRGLIGINLTDVQWPGGLDV